MAAPLVAPGAATATSGLAPAISAANCPSVLLIESTNGKYYLAVFQALAPLRAPIDLTLYSKSGVYGLTLPDVAVSKPISAQNSRYRSLPAVIRNPGEDEFLGATAQPHPASGSSCPDENVLIPPVASLTDPDRHIDPDTDALEAQLASEAANEKDMLVPVAATNVPNPACSDPFEDASVDQLVKPVLTDEQRRDPALLPAAVRVELDADGSVTSVDLESSSGNRLVDAAVIEAARKTTYRPARFACQPEHSSHVVHVDFSK